MNRIKSHDTAVFKSEIKNTLISHLRWSSFLTKHLLTQLTRTCSKSIMEIPEKCVKSYIIVNNKDIRMTSLTLFRCPYW